MISSNSDVLKTNANFYDKFSKINNSREFLSAAYGNSKPKYDSVEFYNDPKKIKKNKAKKILIGLGTAFAIFAGGFALIHGRNVDFNKILKETSENVTEQVGKLKKIGGKAANIMSNFTNIKDDLWDRFAKKTKDKPVLKWIDKIGQALTDFYKKTLHKSLKGEYQKAYEQVIKNANGQKINIQNFDEWFETLDKTIAKGARKDGRITKDLLFKKGFFKKLTESNIADKKILSLPELQESITRLEIPDGASKELIEAIEKFNNQKAKTAQKLLGKLRDINIGSAPTDLLVTLGSIAGLGTGIAMVDNKEEKKSIAINLGIPIIVALGTTMFGTIKAISGAKSLLFGLATGQIASRSADLIDKKINKSKVDKKA